MRLFAFWIYFLNALGLPSKPLIFLIYPLMLSAASFGMLFCDWSMPLFLPIFLFFK